MKAPLKLLLLAFLAAPLALTGCDSSDPSDPDPPTGDDTILDLVVENDDLETLENAVLAAGLDDTLDDEDEVYTVFAPTDDAFDDLDVDDLLGFEDLDDLLLFHVVEGEQRQRDLVVGETLTSARADDGDATFTIVAVGEDDLGIDADGNGVADAVIVETNIDAANGVVHLIDAVLLPDDLRDDLDLARPTVARLVNENEELTTLYTALVTAQLAEVLRAEDEVYTVFAPTDDAFDALVAASEFESAKDLLAYDGLGTLLRYHVLDGAVPASALEDGLSAETIVDEDDVDDTFTIVETDGGFGIDTDDDGVADALITTTDIQASNGLVHLIDAVLVPEELEEDLFLNVVELVVENDDLTVLEDAVLAAELDGTLSDEDMEFTVFAPTDAAFEQLLNDTGLTQEELLASEDLDEILLYHVLGSAVYSGALSDGLVATTLLDEEGATIIIVRTDDGFGIDTNDKGTDANANITTTDIRASNGVVHLIDAVLVPESVDLGGDDGEED